MVVDKICGDVGKLMKWLKFDGFEVNCGLIGGFRFWFCVWNCLWVFGVWRFDLIELKELVSSWLERCKYDLRWIC